MFRRRYRSAGAPEGGFIGRTAMRMVGGLVWAPGFCPRSCGLVSSKPHLPLPTCGLTAKIGQSGHHKARRRAQRRRPGGLHPRSAIAQGRLLGFTPWRVGFDRCSPVALAHLPAAARWRPCRTGGRAGGSGGRIRTTVAVNARHQAATAWRPWRADGTGSVSAPMASHPRR